MGDESRAYLKAPQCLVLTLPRFRARAVLLVRSGKQVKQTAYELGISAGLLARIAEARPHRPREIPGTTTVESVELRAARRKIGELELELAIVRQAAKFLGPEGPTQRIHPVIDRLAVTGIPVDRCCRVLGVSRQGYYRCKRRPTSATQLRRRWLTGLIREVHVASRDTYGYRRIHAELDDGHERASQLPAGLGPDDPGRDLRPSGANAGQATAGRRDVGRFSSTGSSTGSARTSSG